MMHVSLMRHGKVQQTILQVKWSSICNELHIDKTPHQLFSSLSFMYPTILNVVKHGKRLSLIKLPNWASLNEAGTTNNNSGKSSYAYFEFATVLP